MKILLINPSSFINELGFFKRKIFKEAVNTIPPIGLMYIQAHLRKQGNLVKIYDYYLEPNIDKLNNLVTDFSPDVIGFSSTSPAIKNTQKIHDYLRKRHKFISVLGGAHITALPEFLLESNFDYGVVGEGEYALSELVEHIKGNREITNVSSLLYKEKNESLCINKVNRNDSIDFVDMPDYSDIELKRYKPVSFSKKNPCVPIIVSRGCPFDCTHCNKSIFERKVIYRDIENIKKEINFLIKKHNIKELVFFDDMFMENRDLVFQISDFLSYKDLSWSCSSRADQVDEKMLKRMKEGGCYQLFFSFGSGSDKVLSSFNKQTTVKQNKKVIETTKKVDMEVRGSFIVGSPGETKESLEKTFEFALKNDIDFIDFSIYRNLPGNTFPEKNDKEGEEGALNHPKGISKNKLRKKVSRTYRKFYFQFNCILKILERTKSPGNLANNFYSILYDVFLHKF